MHATWEMVHGKIYFMGEHIWENTLHGKIHFLPGSLSESLRAAVLELWRSHKHIHKIVAKLFVNSKTPYKSQFSLLFNVGSWSEQIKANGWVWLCCSSIHAIHRRQCSSVTTVHPMEPELSCDTRGHSTPDLKMKRSCKPSSRLVHRGRPSGPLCVCKVLLSTCRALALM